MLPRSSLETHIERTIRAYPVTVLCGPRQCGKTTLAREIAKRVNVEYFDLEDPISVRRLSEPMTALEDIRGLAVIDEVQRLPELFPILRVLADRRPLRLRFLVLGSASAELLRQSSESLAGRVAFIGMGGFDLGEIEPKKMRRLWWRGRFPRAFLARNESECRSWQENFIRTFLERDLLQFGIQIPPMMLRRLWSMLAYYHGQIWNGSDVGRSLGEAHTTVKRHLDLLTSALVIRQLQPWHANLAKRQVKSPKVYVRDTGLLHALLGVPSFSALEGHPKLGASWEGFVIEEIISLIGERNAYFWATQSGAELDLIFPFKGKRYGVEVKYGDAPGRTKSIASALNDLELERLWVVYPGTKRYSIGKSIEAISLPEFRNEFTRG